MKTRSKNYRLTSVAIAAMLSATSALAKTPDGVGDRGGNGGGEDGVFKSIRNKIGVWVQRNEEINQLETKLELKSISGADFKAKFDQAVKEVGEKIIFNHDEIKFGENIRICRNENKTITCNIEAWNSSGGNTQYMIVLHEYLGIAGIETNIEKDYSQYPISSKILGYVYAKKSFELGMEKIAENCFYQLDLDTNVKHTIYQAESFSSQRAIEKGMDDSTDFRRILTHAIKQKMKEKGYSLNPSNRNAPSLSLTATWCSGVCRQGMGSFSNTSWSEFEYTFSSPSNETIAEDSQKYSNAGYFLRIGKSKKIVNQILDSIDENIQNCNLKQ